MLKKTMIFVSAIVAATVSMSDTASAAPHSHFRSYGTAFAARMPHRTFARTSFRIVRPAWRHVAASRGLRFARRVQIVPRTASHVVSYEPHGTWHRVAMRRRVALAYRAVPFAGRAPASVTTPVAAMPSLALPGLALPGLTVPAATAPVVVDRRGAGGRRSAMRRRAMMAYNAVPFSPAAPIAAAPGAVPASRGQMGRASFYSGGGRTAAGGHVGAATCAHRSLPFGTRVLVTNLANARSTVLTVNDRGPFARGRILDVSVGAAGVLGMLHSGTAPVRVQVVGGPG